MSNYMIWDLNPEIFKIGSIPIRWYGLFFVMTFVIGPKLARYIYKVENRPIEEIETITVACMIGTIIGARLGHVIFYDFNYFSTHIIEAFLPISLTPHFHFTGYRGLASHGAGIGLIISTYLISKYKIKVSLFPPKFSINPLKKFRSNFRWLSDTIAIFVALAGFCIRMGNFSNSEIYGQKTTKPYGIVFARNIIDRMQNSSAVIEKATVTKGSTNLLQNKDYKPIIISIFFKKGRFAETDVRDYLENNIKHMLKNDVVITEHVFQQGQEFSYSLAKDNTDKYVASIHTYGIPRHASQLYEALSCLLLFFILTMWWKFRWKKIKEGSICGIFFVYIFTLRFFYEFLKMSYNPFPDTIPINMPQILSIGAIIIGLIYTFTAKKTHGDTRPQ